jgi:HK97 family phage portal protein
MLNLLQNFLNYKKVNNPNHKPQGNNTYFYSSGKAVWMDRNYQVFANDAYIKNVIAHRSINMISQAAASVSFKLFQERGGARIEVKDHPLLKLLQNPNPASSGKDLLETLYSYRLINGNAYLLAVCAGKDKPQELIALRPDRVQVITGDNYLPVGYRYVVDGKSLEFPVDPISGASLILHLKNFHPLSDWYGLSSIEAAAYSIDQHNEAGAWNQSLLQNGARPSGAVIVKGLDGKPGRLTDEQYQRLKRMIDETFSGPQNSGRPIVMEGGLEWKEMSISPKDMDFIESKHSSARDIALAFGVPPQLLGIPGDNTYSNLVEARISFWEQTVIPLLENTTQHLNNWLRQFYGRDLTLTFDSDNITVITEKKEKIWERLEKVSFMTINEKRISVGLAPVEGGDRF